MSPIRFCYYICNCTESTTHLVLLFVLLGYVPDKWKYPPNSKTNLNVTSWQRHGKNIIGTYWTMLVYLQLDWINCTPGFVVCASGLFPGEYKTHNYKQDPKLNSWLESIYKTRNTQIPSTIFCYCMLNLTDLNTHLALLFVLLGYLPDKDKIHNYEQNINLTSSLMPEIEYVGMPRHS